MASGPAVVAGEAVISAPGDGDAQAFCVVFDVTLVFAVALADGHGDGAAMPAGFDPGELWAFAAAPSAPTSANAPATTAVPKYFMGLCVPARARN